jgi:poly(hydroxyalkanoate) depolymerase family esterase
MLHGCTQDPEDFAAGTRMNRLAAEHGVLVLYPTQTREENAARCWNWFLPQNQRPERGEPALLAALTQAVMAEHDADPARVYVAGLSAGGAMADILGRTHPALFAAVGVHSGLPCGAARDLVSAIAAMKNGPGAHRAAAGPMPPAIVFHGDADETVHPRNGEQLVADALAGGGLGPARETHGHAPGGRAFTRRTHADAHGRIVVEHWRVHGGGHAWAGGSAEGSFTDPAGPDASAEMLRFFLAHPRLP